MTALSIAAICSLCAQVCQPNAQVAPGTLLSVAWTESSWDPSAEKHNHNGTTDRGIAQINSSNWQRLGLTRESATEPCLSLRAATRVLLENFHPLDNTPNEQQRALRVALAAYNAGPLGGANLRYVRSVEAAARYVIPEIRAAGIPAEGAAPASAAGAAAASALEPGEPPRWDKWAHREWLEKKQATVTIHETQETDR